MMQEGRKPTIGVIIPNRNDARFLPRCLRSVLDQPDPPDEVIVVDDQSTDDSVAVIRSVIDGRGNARLVQNATNLGVYGAVDEGLKRSRSEYVLCLSANDFVLPGIFAAARAAFTRHPGVGLWSAMGWLVDDEGQPLGWLRTPLVALSDACFTPEQCRRLAWRYGNWFTGTTVIYRRDALERAGRFDPAYKGLSDLVTALVVASREGAAYSPAPMAVVRQHEGSYIARTMTSAAGVESMVGRLSESGPRLEPRLFTAAYIERTALRLRYGALRASGENTGEIARTLGPWRRRALEWSRARGPLAFLILRPFDVWPVLWTRLLGMLFFAMSPAWSRKRLPP